MIQLSSLLNSSKQYTKKTIDTHTHCTHIFFWIVLEKDCMLPNSFYDLAEILITNTNSGKEIQVNIFHENGMGFVN